MVQEVSGRLQGLTSEGQLGFQVRNPFLDPPCRAHIRPFSNAGVPLETLLAVTPEKWPLPIKSL